MDFYAEIKKILETINSNAIAYYLEKSRFERETQNMVVPAVNINPQFSGTIAVTEGQELTNTTRLEVLFLSQDELDNSDLESEQIISAMRILANSVFIRLRKIKDILINEYRFENKIRVNSNSMSGVQITATVIYKDSKICDYGV